MKYKNLIILFFAIIVGLIFSLENILPYLATRNSPDKIYTVFKGGDENLYAAEIREVLEGKLFSGDAFIYENRQKPPFTQWLAILVMGLLAKVFGSLELIHLLGNFFFPAGIFLLIFSFVDRITKHYWGAVVTALATLFLFQLTTKLPPLTPSLFHSFLNMITLKEPVIFGFSSLVTRQFSFMVFFLFIISFYELLNNNHKKYWPILCGLSSGLLIYIYIYYWTASAVILGIGFLLKRGKPLFWAGIYSILASAYFLIPYSQGGLIERQIAEGRIDGRFFEPLTTLRYGVFCVAIFLLIKNKPLKQLLLSIFLAAVILMNLQLILGYTVDPGHWPNAVFEPMAVIAVGLMVFSRFKRFTKHIWLLIIPIVFYALANQAAMAKALLSTRQLTKNENELFQWLNHYGQADSVVLTLDKRLNRYLPVLTPVYVYLPYGALTQLSLDQIWERADLAFSIYNLNQEEISKKLLETQFIGHLFEQSYNYLNVDDLSGLDFPDEAKIRISRAQPVFSLGVRYIPDNIKQTQAEKTLALEKLPLKERICRYRLDYVIVTAGDQPSPFISSGKDIFQPVLEKGSLSLYRINPKLCQN